MMKAGSKEDGRCADADPDWRGRHTWTPVLLVVISSTSFLPLAFVLAIVIPASYQPDRPTVPSLSSVVGPTDVTIRVVFFLVGAP